MKPEIVERSAECATLLADQEHSLHLRALRRCIRSASSITAAPRASRASSSRVGQAYPALARALGVSGPTARCASKSPSKRTSPANSGLVAQYSLPPCMRNPSLSAYVGIRPRSPTGVFFLCASIRLHRQPVYSSLPNARPLTKTGAGRCRGALPRRTLTGRGCPGAAAAISRLVSNEKELAQRSCWAGTSGYGVEAALRGPLYLLDCPELYKERRALPYGRVARTGRTTALASGPFPTAALMGGAASPLDWRPDVVHCKDWPTALTPVTSSTSRVRSQPAEVHNLAFQGLFEPSVLSMLELRKRFSVERLEFYGRRFPQGRPACADAVSTVSPTYAAEIRPTRWAAADGPAAPPAQRPHGILTASTPSLGSGRRCADRRAL